MSEYTVLTKAENILSHIAVLPDYGHAELVDRTKRLNQELLDYCDGFPNAASEITFLSMLEELDEDIRIYSEAVRAKYNDVLTEQLKAIQSKVVEELNSNYPDLETLAHYYSLMSSIRAAKAGVTKASWIEDSVMSMELQMLDWLKH